VTTDHIIILYAVFKKRADYIITKAIQWFY